MMNDNLRSFLIMVEEAINIRNKKGYLDEKDVDIYLKDVLTFFQGSITLSNADILFLKNEILHRYQIKQIDGVLLLDDYVQDNWYHKIHNSIEPIHWSYYVEHLKRDKFMPQNVIDSIDASTTTILNSLGDPRSKTHFLRRGLILGDVQSGKTSNYIGLINKAVDAGYKVIILLTGLSEVLRKQTQIRVEEGFIGWDITSKLPVGVGRLHKGKGIAINSPTTRERDFVGERDETTAHKLDETNKYIYVIKKNVTVLKKLKETLKSFNTNTLNPQIDLPLLIIDDEADNASINTRRPDYDPTATNKLIRELMNLFTKSNYVGYTATPYANVFIDPETESDMFGQDLFPENFIYLLNAEENDDYFGPRKMEDLKNQFIRFIKNPYEDNLFTYEIDKLGWDGKQFHPELTDAIYAYFLACLIMDSTQGITNHRTMLINVSRFINRHIQLKNYVEKIVEKAKDNIYLHIKNENERNIQNKVILHLYSIWKKEYKENISWEKVKKNLYKSIKDIEIKIINSSSFGEKLDYELYPNGLKVIAIGGYALSRGLTLEGLVISYFYRNTKTFDVLMQMGRWFGYRRGYVDLCRLWIEQDSYEYYNDINASTIELKNDIKKMKISKKGPRQFGIRVRNDSEELNITAPNKMRSTRRKLIKHSFYGEVFETAYIAKDIRLNGENYNTVIKFANSLINRDNNVANPYFRNIDNELIYDFIDSLNIFEHNIRFDTKQILEFIKKELNNHKPYWDVLFMQGNRNDETAIELKNNLKIHPVERQFDISNNELIRISKQRARLGAKLDTSFGLDGKVKKQVEFIADKVNQKTYLIEERNPLLIIYLIALKPREDDFEQMSFVNDLAKEAEPLVGLSVAFPSNSSYLGERLNEYVVNKNADYFYLREQDDWEEEDLDD